MSIKSNLPQGVYVKAFKATFFYRHQQTIDAVDWLYSQNLIAKEDPSAWDLQEVFDSVFVSVEKYLLKQTEFCDSCSALGAVAPTDWTINEIKDIHATGESVGIIDLTKLVNHKEFKNLSQLSLCMDLGEFDDFCKFFLKLIQKAMQKVDDLHHKKTRHSGYAAYL